MSEHTRSTEDDPRMRAILALPPEGRGFICADCGTAAEVHDAAVVKSALVTDILLCRGEGVDLFIDARLPSMAVGWLRRFGYGPGAAVELIGNARRLGMLDGEGDELRLGDARCMTCYLKRAEAYVLSYDGVAHG
jgi:hypothetical protein